MVWTNIAFLSFYIRHGNWRKWKPLKLGGSWGMLPRKFSFPTLKSTHSEGVLSFTIKHFYIISNSFFFLFLFSMPRLPYATSLEQTRHLAVPRTSILQKWVPVCSSVSPTFTTLESHSHFHLFCISISSKTSPRLTTLATEDMFHHVCIAHIKMAGKRKWQTQCIPHHVCPLR